MTWQPIVVGVDGSPESVRAAVMGSLTAEAAGTDCRLVHAVPDYLATVSAPEIAGPIVERVEDILAQARALVAGTLERSVPREVLESLEVEVGRAPIVLAEAARRHGAELVVLGGKHHTGLGRWLSSTLHHMVRTAEVPVLATDGSRGLDRVLAAVDLSYAAGPTILAAGRFASLFNARLRVMHSVEPIPVIPGFPLDVDDDECFRSTERLLESGVWPLIESPGAETVIRRGRAAAAIVNEARMWRADLVVVGSHGKGWVDRLLIGSTSERLLTVLPTLVLVVPAPRPTEVARRGAALSAAARS
jgi:nucleotide-binding universal stress UspA family protein